MSMEERHLAQADRHIAESERRISEQEARLSDLAAGGHDTSEAERLLANFRETLLQFHAHRQMIVEALATEAPG